MPIFHEENLNAHHIPIEYSTDDNQCHNVISHKVTHRTGHIKVRRNAKHQFIHRYVYEQTKGEIGEGLVVRHTCDNPACINPDHLITGTVFDNNRDRSERGRSARMVGETNGCAVLTESQVREIKLDRTSTHTDLGYKYGVSRITISNIRNNKKWKHVVV